MSVSFHLIENRIVISLCDVCEKMKFVLYVIYNVIITHKDFIRQGFKSKLTFLCFFLFFKKKLLIHNFTVNFNISLPAVLLLYNINKRPRCFNECIPSGKMILTYFSYLYEKNIFHIFRKNDTNIFFIFLWKNNISNLGLTLLGTNENLPTKFFSFFTLITLFYVNGGPFQIGTI